MKVKGLVFISLALVLVLSLMGVACAGEQPASSGATAADCSAVEAQLASEKAARQAADAKVSSLEAQLAAGQKPAKVYRMEPATWIASGTPYDFLLYMAEWINANTNGRIEMTPSAPGAVCPVEEQIEATAAGTTLAMLSTPSYYAGKFDLAALYNTCIGLPSAYDQQNCYEVFMDGKLQKMYFDRVEGLYNVKCVGTRYGEVDQIFSSSVNIPDIDALAGVKFRCGDEHIAGPLTSFGASTVWFPGTEIYTNLATGVVDAFTYGSAYDHQSIGAHEVTKYWLKSPALVACVNEQFVVNRDAWNEMGAELQNEIREAIAAANQRSGTEAFYMNDKAWSEVTAAGVEPIYWSDEDAAAWVQAQYDWAKQYTDQYPACAEFMEVIKAYREFKGF